MAECLVVKDAERSGAAVFGVSMSGNGFVLSEYGPANIAQMTTTAMFIFHVRFDVKQTVGDKLA